MTKEEAIKIIDEECEHIKHHLTEKGKAEDFYIELGNMVIAFNMAIKALEQESKTGYCKECEKKVTAVLDKIIDEIQEYKSRKILEFGVEDLEKGKETALDYVFAIIDQCRPESEG